MAPWHLSGQLGVKRPQVQVLSLGPKLPDFSLKSGSFLLFLFTFQSEPDLGQPGMTQI